MYSDLLSTAAQVRTDYALLVCFWDCPPPKKIGNDKR